MGQIYADVRRGRWGFDECRTTHCFMQGVASSLGMLRSIRGYKSDIVRVLFYRDPPEGQEFITIQVVARDLCSDNHYYHHCLYGTYIGEMYCQFMACDPMIGYLLGIAKDTQIPPQFYVVVQEVKVPYAES